MQQYDINHEDEMSSFLEEIVPERAVDLSRIELKIRLMGLGFNQSPEMRTVERVQQDNLTANLQYWNPRKRYKFRATIFSYHVVIHTDHSALVHLFRQTIFRQPRKVEFVYTIQFANSI